MSSSSPRQHDTPMPDFVEDYLDGVATDAQRAALATWLRASPENLKRFARQAYLDGSIGSILSSQQHTQEAHESQFFDLTDHVSLLDQLALLEPKEPLELVDLTEELKRRKLKEHQKKAAENRWRLGLNQGDTPKVVNYPFVISKLVAVLGVAAVIGLVVWLGLDDAPKDQQPPQDTVVTSPQEIVSPNYVARITRFAGVQDAFVKTEGQLEAGVPISIESGFVEVTFSQSAKVVIQGPATFTPVGTHAMHLSVGQLATSLGGQTEGFRVTTPTASIVDLSTSFAASVEQDGSTEVHILRGSVVVSGRGDNARNLLVAGGHAVSVNTAGALKPISYDPVRFVKDWAEVAAPPEVSGAVRLETVMLDTGFETHQYEARYARLFSLARGLSLDQPLTLDLGRPGMYQSPLMSRPPRDQRRIDSVMSRLPAGTTFDLYLVHFDPIGGSPDTADNQTITFRVAFGREILGVLGQSNFPMDVPELRNAFQQSPQADDGISELNDLDRLSLSADRLTLDVSLTSGLNCDRFWILVKHEEADSP